MNSTEATWTPGVIARYLTVGGATVDLTEHPAATHVPAQSVAECRGCPATKVIDWTIKSWDESVGDYDDERDPDGASYTADARDWAQAHASTCRAMVMPEVTR
jgi:hypothetical protein